MPLLLISASGAFRTRGTLRHEVGWDCQGGGGGCRRKRSADEADDATAASHADLTLHLSTEEAVLSGAARQVKIRLRRSPPLLSPDYKLVVRGDNGASTVNRTVPFPSCLYTGEVEGTPGATVAVSTCQENKLVSSIDAFSLSELLIM